MQDDLYGAHLRDGGLYVPYARNDSYGSARNSSHWTINSIVGDHAYGRFNESPDGTFKGRVVLIADPREMPVPGGLGQVDTWFRWDASPTEDGKLERGLAIGRGAVVVAPDDVQVPEGVEVVRYVGGIDARDKAVHDVLRSRSIDVQEAGMWGWAGRNDSAEWATETARVFYAGRENAVHIGAHAGSVDDRIETATNRLNELLKQFETERLYVRPDGAEVPMADVILQEIVEQRSDIQALIASLPQDELERIGAFYQERLAALNTQQDLVRTIERSWNAQVPRLPEPAASFVPPPLEQPSAVGPPPLEPPAAVPRASNMYQTADAFNAALHQRVNLAVRDAHARVIDTAQLPESSSLIELFARNLRAGRPLLEGMNVYRGSKDPDVDAGTFDGNFKHATAIFTMARGYAETANSHIGLVSKQTRGIGMLAEYELPEDAVFYRNFGIESSDSPTTQVEALTVGEADRRLTPLVEAYLAAHDADGLRAATEAAQGFCEAYFYELQVPAAQTPVRQWVVQTDDAGVRGRLLEHQDRGPLAEVIIDAVRARKTSVDEYLAGKVSSDLKRGGRTGLAELDGFSPGLASTLTATAGMIDATLSDLRDQTFAVDHESVSAAIAWRKEAQQSIRMARLTNSGISIEHENPRLKLMPLLQRSLEEIEEASWQLNARPRRVEVLTVFSDAMAVSHEMGRCRSEFEIAALADAEATAAFDDCKESINKAVEHLDALERLHAAKRAASFFSRAFYRFGEQSLVQGEMQAQRALIVELEQRLDVLSIRSKETRLTLEARRGAIGRLAEQLTTFERQLQTLQRNGDLGFLPENLSRKATGLTISDWSMRADAASQKLREADASISMGRQRAALFGSIARQGLDTGVTDLALTTSSTPDSIEASDLALATTGPGPDPGERTRPAMKPASPDSRNTAAAVRASTADPERGVAVATVGDKVPLTTPASAVPQQEPQGSPARGLKRLNPFARGPLGGFSGDSAQAVVAAPRLAAVKPESSRAPDPDADYGHEP
ncbi:hypothetical protein IQ289_31350 [Burkholderia sp. R-70006]|uniref:hypothetical protein n=1 Tax=Paraburkholderia domus TaxID=2793075 RepID=UPI001913318D|nr:hypothetical protein [Paraburkholderia domus]MBK5052881.1 hypothetical protein [Burkholderia sp. R-70006]